MRKKSAQHKTPQDYKRIVVPVSGGKDSQLCFAMAIDLVGPAKVLGVHQHTGFDHPLTYEHMNYMREHYGAEIIDVHSDQYKTVPEVMYGEIMVPSRHARLCTRILKTGPWFKWLKEQPDAMEMLVLLGMRAAESTNRRSNYGDLSDSDIYRMADISGECPAALREVRCQLPIVSMSTPRVYSTLRERGDKINPLYALGHKRVGCFPCLLAGKGSMKLTVRDPVGRKNIEIINHAIKFVEKKRPELVISDFFDHDLDDLLANKEQDPFGILEDDEQTAGGCSWCNQ